MENTRVEFGRERTKCGCRDCRINCQFMPGYLIPSDLERMIPAGIDPYQWADTNLSASPGALVSQSGRQFRIHTLVPAAKPDGSCIHLQDGLCNIHAVSPFGCAFFDCRSLAADSLSAFGLSAIYAAGPDSLYHRLWGHLWATGCRAPGPEVARARMAKAL